MFGDHHDGWGGTPVQKESTKRSHTNTHTSHTRTTWTLTEALRCTHLSLCRQNHSRRCCRRCQQWPHPLQQWRWRPHPFRHQHPSCSGHPCPRALATATVNHRHHKPQPHVSKQPNTGPTRWACSGTRGDTRGHAHAHAQTNTLAPMHAHARTHTNTYRHYTHTRARAYLMAAASRTQGTHNGPNGAVTSVPSTRCCTRKPPRQAPRPMSKADKW